MGLSSLPILNKLGYNNYWTNLFFSNKLYVENLSTILTVEMLISVLSTERFFFNYFNKLYYSKTYRSYLTSKKAFILHNRKIKTYTGEFWFMIYADFFLVSTAVYNSNVINEKSLKLRTNQNLLTLFYLDYEANFE